MKTDGYAVPMDTQTCTYTRRDSVFKDFYPLSKIPKSQVDGFETIVRVGVRSDYGHIHILLSELNDNVNSNNGYEFGNNIIYDYQIINYNQIVLSSKPMGSLRNSSKRQSLWEV